MPEVAPCELLVSRKPVRRKFRFPRSRLYVRSLRRSPQRFRSLRLAFGSRLDVLGLDRASSEADRETTRSLRTLRGANTRSPVWSSEARRRGLDYPRASLNRDAPVEPLETGPALFREPEFSRVKPSSERNAVRAELGTRSTPPSSGGGGFHSPVLRFGSAASLPVTNRFLESHGST